MDAAATDPLLLLRATTSQGLVPTLSADSLTDATELNFPPCPPLTTTATTLPLVTATRFTKDSDALDLRTIFYAWQQRDTSIGDYISQAQTIGINHLSFLERLELVTYLEGGQEESDHITPLPKENAAKDATPSSNAAKQQVQVAPGRSRPTDPRLAKIYGYERVITNRNTMLRGIKPTDFSHVRKNAQDFISRLRATPNKPPTNTNGTNPAAAGRPGTLAARNARPSKPSRNRDPIILLSPSASALLTMSNIKPFLESGTFVQPALNAGPTPQIHHISRLLPTINPTASMRFIIVDSPDKFKPDYWERVVAVFTTGQEWQFRSYKWSAASDLFRNVRAFYAGWEGERPPETVQNWGAAVNVISIDRARRFKDREIVERFWDAVEGWMRTKGWGGR